MLPIIFREIEDDIPLDDEILTLKQYAADLLHYVLKRVQDKTPELKLSIVNLLLNKLFQSPVDEGSSPQHKAPSPHLFFGCLCALKTFGVSVTKSHIVPHLRQLADRLMQGSQSGLAGSKSGEAL